MADAEISSIIAEKMAQVHSLDVPISKEPTWLWDTMTRWMENMKQQQTLSQEPVQAAKSVLRWQLDAEMEWMRIYLAQLRSAVVFCHNDLQEGNILIRETAQTPEDKLVIIDFEYCSYNYRGFDLANHFCEWMYDYTNEKYPKFHYQPTGMPSIDQRVCIQVTS